MEKDIPDGRNDSSTLAKKIGFDHFRDEEVNPIKTNAMSGC